MNKLRGAMAVVCMLAMSSVVATSAQAQTSEVKEKPPMYSYIGNWAIPRAQWAEMDKNTAADAKVLDKALAAGTIIGYGNDVNLVHEVDGMTHDDWWSAMSMAGLINVLEQFYQSGGAAAPVLNTATKHVDAIYVSRYYNWHPGSYKNVYTHVGSYKLKADAPDDAVETLSKGLIVPLLEKMLADGAIHEYEVDTHAIHSEAPGTFLVVYIAANAAGLDKVNAAVQEALKASPLSGPAFGSMTDSNAHRDSLARTNATYK
jgi:hypothetical protein